MGLKESLPPTEKANRWRSAGACQGWRVGLTGTGFARSRWSDGYTRSGRKPAGFAEKPMLLCLVMVALAVDIFWWLKR